MPQVQAANNQQERQTNKKITFWGKTFSVPLPNHNISKVEAVAYIFPHSWTLVGLQTSVGWGVAASYLLQDTEVP